MRNKIGFLGGTFDPVHIGHLRLALELKQALGLNEMRLLPCHKPPHRDLPQASSQQRLDMLRIALQDCVELQLDDREMQRDKPSYTYDTLLELRAELGGEVSLVLCMGADAFAGLTSWYCWQQLLELAHIVVIARPQFSLPNSGELFELLQRHQGDIEGLDAEACGSIVLQSLRLLPISATDIRDQLLRGESAQFLVPEGVWQYLAAHHLYR